MKSRAKVFWISTPTPSSKNSKRWTGKFLISSKITLRWKEKTKHEWEQQRESFINALFSVEGPPYYIEFTFVRHTKHRLDYHNIVQAPLDAMVKHGWLADDDSKNVKPYFGDVKYDKFNPGVEIRILKNKPKHYDTQNQ